jgi:hypothetical protein
MRTGAGACSTKVLMVERDEFAAAEGSVHSVRNRNRQEPCLSSSHVIICLASFSTGKANDSNCASRIAVESSIHQRISY